MELARGKRSEEGRGKLRRMPLLEASLANKSAFLLPGIDQAKEDLAVGGLKIGEELFDLKDGRD